jgi:hypothetical protein
MQQAILISSAIVAHVLLTQYGRRRFSWRARLPGTIGIPVATAVYLSRAPAHRYDIYLYLVSAAAGCGFGALATAAIGVERDPGAGRLYTRCGVLCAGSSTRNSQFCARLGYVTSGGWRLAAGVTGGGRLGAVRPAT